jgi:hypothetical protein
MQAIHLSRLIIITSSLIIQNFKMINLTYMTSIFNVVFYTMR